MTVYAPVDPGVQLTNPEYNLELTKIAGVINSNIDNGNINANANIDQIKINGVRTGAMTFNGGVTITNGAGTGLTVSDGVTVSSGGILIDAGGLIVDGGMNARTGGIIVTVGGLNILSGNAVDIRGTDGLNYNTGTVNDIDCNIVTVERSGGIFAAMDYVAATTSFNFNLPIIIPSGSLTLSSGNLEITGNASISGNTDGVKVSTHAHTGVGSDGTVVSFESLTIKPFVDVKDFVSFSAAVTAVNTAASKVLRLSTAITMDASAEILSDVIFEFVSGGTLTFGTFTLTLNSEPVISSLQEQIFIKNSSGSAVFNRDSVEKVRPEWFGFVPNNTGYTSVEAVSAWNSISEKDKFETDAPFVIDSSVTLASTNASTFVYDNFLYVCEFTVGFISVFSLRDPAVPLLISRLNVGGTPRGIVVRDDIAYVANLGSNVIQILDVSLKTGMSVIKAVATTKTSPKDLVINGNDLYVVFNSGWVQKWHIDGRDQITKHYEVVTFPNPLTVAIANDSLYVGGGSGASTGKIDFFNLATLAVNSTTLIDQWISFLEAKGDILYAVDFNTNKLYVLDIKGATNPTVITSIATSANPSTCRVVGDRLYIPCLVDPGIMDVFDISVPSAPVKIYQLNMNQGQSGFMAFKDNFAYVTGHTVPLTLDVVHTGKKFEKEDYISDLDRRADNNYIRDHQPYRYLVTKIGAYTATLQDDIIRVGLGAIMTLPTPAINWTGKTVEYENVDAINDSTITDGSDTWILHAKSSRTFVCDGARWDTLSSHNSAGITGRNLNGDVTMTDIEAESELFEKSGGTANNLIVPLIKKKWIIVNKDSGTLTVKGTTGTSVLIATLNTAQVYCDGTNVHRLTADVAF